jgi:hypothetical protein
MIIAKYDLLVISDFGTYRTAMFPIATVFHLPNSAGAEVHTQRRNCSP